MLKNFSLTSQKKSLLALSAMMIVVATALVLAVSDKTNIGIKSYMGLTIAEARQKARVETRSYTVRNIRSYGYPSDPKHGLILYSNNGVIVDGEESVEEGAEHYLGLTEAEATEKAKSNGLKSRVIARDGEYFIITLDYSTRRVNFYIHNDKVVDAYFR